jgi:hypothetical protein
MFVDLGDLDKIDWSILQRRDFQRDPENPEKVERYEAEALIHKHLPLDSLEEIACCDAAGAASIQQEVTKRSLALKITTKPGWYF